MYGETIEEMNGKGDRNMGLTRKFLAALGIESDKVDEIINAHAETVNGLKEEAENYKADAEKLATVQKELETLKKSTAGKDYDKLAKEFEDYKAEIAAKETRAAKEKAYRDALKDSNLTDRGIEKAIKFADWDKIELEDDGTLKGAKDHVKAAREEWAEYVSKTTTDGAKTPTPPANTGGKVLTREQIYAKDDHGRYIMDTAARQKALAESLAAQN